MRLLLVTTVAKVVLFVKLVKHDASKWCSEGDSHVSIFGANRSRPKHPNDADNDHSIASHLHTWQ